MRWNVYTDEQLSRFNRNRFFPILYITRKPKTRNLVDSFEAKQTLMLTSSLRYVLGNARGVDNGGKDRTYRSIIGPAAYLPVPDVVVVMFWVLVGCVLGD